MTIRTNAKTIAIATVAFALSGFFLMKLASFLMTLRAMVG